MRLLTDAELLAWFNSAPWQEAVTMPEHPHEYTLRRQQDERTFLRVVATIWSSPRSYDRPYIGRLWRSLDIGESWYVWVCTEPGPDVPPPLSETILINRARVVQPELFR